jgi:hypothetical protein
MLRVSTLTERAIKSGVNASTILSGGISKEGLLLCQAYSQTGIDKGDKAKKARFLFEISAF